MKKGEVNIISWKELRYPLWMLSAIMLLISCSKPEPKGLTQAQLRKTDNDSILQFNVVLQLNTHQKNISIEPSQLEVFVNDQLLGTSVLVAETSGNEESVNELPLRVKFNAKNFVLTQPAKVTIKGVLHYNGSKKKKIDFTKDVDVLNVTLR